MISTVGNSFAQDSTSVNSNLDSTSVARDIRVEKDYIPEIKSINRPHIEMISNEPEVSKDDVKYSEYESLITPKSVFNPLPQTDLRVLKRKKAKNGYTQLGFGFPLLWNAEIFYPIVNSKTTSLIVDAKSDAYFTKKQYIDTYINLKLNHKLSKKTALITAIAYENSYFNYYGNDNISRDSLNFYNVNDIKLRGDSLTPNKQNIHRAKATFGIKSIKPSDDLQYEAIANYKFSYFSSNNLNEHQIDFRAGISKRLQEIHYLTLFADINSTIYNKPNNIIKPEAKTNTVIGIYPAYQLKWNSLKVKAGAKIFVSTPNGTTVTGSPDVHANYTYRNLIDASIGFDGHYNVNSISSLIEKNRYFNVNRSLEENTYSPFRTYLTVNVRPISGLLINARANYSIVKNQYFFTNDYFSHISNPNDWTNSTTTTQQSNLFFADVYNANLLNVGITANYNHQEKYIVYASFDYTKGMIKDKSVKPWYLPAFKVKAGGKVEVYKDLYLNLDFNFESPRNYSITNSDGSKTIGTLTPIYDLNFGAYYTIQDTYTVFAKVNNILGNITGIRYQQWYGYDNIGCNVLFGINVSF